MYSFDKSTKKIIDPMGASLSVKDTVTQLNRMYEAVVQLHLAWRIVGDGMSVMDGVFMGASQPEPEVIEGETSDSETPAVDTGLVSEESTGVQDSEVVLR